MSAHPTQDCRQPRSVSKRVEEDFLQAAVPDRRWPAHCSGVTSAACARIRFVAQ